ncbi:hypothetical protein AALP_AA1G207700, partial [Arabis alpina]
MINPPPINYLLFSSTRFLLLLLPFLHLLCFSWWWMGVGDPLPLPPDKIRPEIKPPDIASTSSSASVVNVADTLSDSPILLFVYFHKAFRAQLTELHRLAAGDVVQTGYDLAVELRRKFDFLKLVYKYHSAAEDE